ncbi:MAG TPA: fumarylacetoacetate hydrolase family protein [Steroidobacteraceae bacterium]|jgi:2,4-diketo-3-deoxy-L-fuconate hydrolase|nr:fumarylacetoacetate hydrolase family protein [Steroidobacteraceae bacterium]
MKFGLGTFSRSGAAPFPGLALGERVVRLDGFESVLAILSSWDRNFTELCRLAEADRAAESVDMRELRVHAPLEMPRQVFCTIANYRSHILDTVRDPGSKLRLGEPDTPECRARAAQAIAERLRSPPYVCLKLPSTVIGPDEPLTLPHEAQRLDWELELAVVIGRAGRRIARAEAMSYVAGYTLANDITARDLVVRPDLPRLGSDWLQSKNAPGFLPLGPYIVPAAFVPDPYALRLTFRLNGEVMQDELVGDMLFDIAAQIEYISKYAQLLPGDVICTGTPAGCGFRYQRFLKPGDVMEGSAPGLGVLRTSCAGEAST